MHVKLSFVQVIHYSFFVRFCMFCGVKLPSLSADCGSFGAQRDKWLFLFKQQEQSLKMTIWTREWHKPALSLHSLWWPTPHCLHCSSWLVVAGFIAAVQWRGPLPKTFVPLNSKVTCPLSCGLNSPEWRRLICTPKFPGFSKLLFLLVENFS